MKGSADWVKYCKRRWGEPPKSKLILVRSISKDDTETVKPDKDEDPPF
jgi:hypothetical protein